MMNAREYLNSIVIAGKRIKQKQERIMQLRESLVSLSAPMGKEQVSHTRNVSVMCDTIACITDMEHEIDHQTEQLYQLRSEALKYFDQLSPDYSKILEMRYYNDMSISEMMKKLSYCRSSVFSILNKATDALQTLFQSLDETGL